MSEANVITEAIRADAGAWFENYGKIWPKDRNRGLIKPKQNFLQREIQRTVAKFEEIGLPIRIIGLKPRQKGSTTYFSAVDYCQLRRRSAYACVIGGQYSQTTEIWEMLRTYAKEDKFDWGNSGEINTKEGRWTNGSRLKAETAGDALAGIAGTYQILHATEVARWSRYGVANAAEVLTNILKCVPLLPDTVVILESTAEGAAGSFYERWLGAVDMEDFLSGKIELQPGQYVRVFAAWFEFEDSCLRLTEKQKQEIQKTLDSDEEYSGEQELIDLYGCVDEDGVQHLGTSVRSHDVWEQLAWRRFAIREECKRDKAIFDRDYPHSWRDAFLKSGNRRFNNTGLSMLRKNLTKHTPIHGVMELNRTRATFRPSDEREATVTIWEKPVPGRRFLMSVDPMTGATQVAGEDPDKHGVFVLRAGYYNGSGKWIKPAAVARIVPCRWDIDVLEGKLWPLARFYGGQVGCKIAIEMNMDRGLTELLKLRGADLYQRELFNQREFKTTPALGFSTTYKTRENLVETLARAIREWDTPGDGIDIWCPHAIEQAENFIIKANGRTEAADGFHDDDVLSLGLGLTLIDQATTYSSPDIFLGLPPDLRQSSGGSGINQFS